MRVGRAGFNDQDAITLNGKKLWLPERERERENAEKLRARSFIPSKKSVSAMSSRSITVHPVNLVEGDIWGGPASRKFVPILCISDNSGNKGWSEMMAWRAFTPESTTLHNTCMQKSVVVERMIKKPWGYLNKLNSNFWFVSLGMGRELHVMRSPRVVDLFNDACALITHRVASFDGINR